MGYAPVDSESRGGARETALAVMADVVRPTPRTRLAHLTLYAERSKVELASVTGKTIILASVKFSTNRCLQNGAYPSTRSAAEHRVLTASCKAAGGIVMRAPA